MPITIRKSSERGYYDYEWLKTYHTFSFGQYEDPHYMGFRSLRVINENRVRPAVGFPVQAHKNMEIFSLVIEGRLAYQDTMGNGSIFRPGQISFLRAGTGVTHTETNASQKDEVLFWQFWITPDTKGLEPSYTEKEFSKADRHNQWDLIFSKDGHDDSIKIHQDVNIYWTELDEGFEINFSLPDKRYGWLQLLEGNIQLNGKEMESGDGAAISEINEIKLKAIAPSNLLFFDLN